MGMSSSQARLLSLTGRMHDIEYKAQKLEAQKLQMANESAYVYQKYENALNATTIQGATIGADGSTNFVDATLLVLEGNAINRLGKEIYLKDTKTDKIYVSRANADKFQLPEDGNPGTEIEFMDRLGLKSVVLGFEKVSNSDPIAKYTAIETEKGAITQREVPNFNPDWGYQTVTPKPIPADAVSVKSVADANGTFDVNKTYVINTENDLVALQNLTNKGVNTEGVHFILGGNLEMKGINWTGIGNTSANAFKGIFDGNGYRIKNLTGSAGLFTFVTGNSTATTDSKNGVDVTEKNGVIKNVILENVNVTRTGQNTGALIGQNNGGYVDNCYASGNISGASWTGGLIGYNIGGIVTSCTSNVNINKATNCTGGFIGHDTNGILEHCISTGTVNGTSSVGGLIGHEYANGKGFIYQCATTSDVNGSVNKGAFIGLIDSGCSAVVVGSQYSGASGLKPVGAGNVTNEGNDDSLTEGSSKIVTTTNINLPSLASVKSNIMMAIDKSKLTVPADFDKKLTTWLNQFYNEDTYTGGVLVEDSLKLASINDFLNKYLTSGSNSDIVNGIISDVNNNSLTNTKMYQDNYKTTKDYEYTGYASTGTGNATKVNSMTIGSTEDISNNLYTALRNAGHTELKYADDIQKVEDWVNAKFNVNTSAGKLALAELNNIIMNGDKEELEKIYSAINNNSNYTVPTDKKVYTDTVGTYNITVQDQDQTYQTGWDMTDPDIVEALKYYQVIKGGYIIVEDEQASSTEWLTNMINGGFAIFTQYDSEEKNLFETNIATNVSLQEVTDKTEIKKAEAEYEASMRKIDAKDKRYDVELAALENERNAIKTEMETLKTVIKDNVDRTFKLFG